MNRFVVAALADVAVSLVAFAAFAQQAPKPAAAAPAATPPAAAQVQTPLLGQYGDWGAYTASPAGNKICFALSKPKSSKTEPVGRKRDQSYMFVSTRPAENVRNEVSIAIGYPFQTTSDATAEVGTA